MISLRRLVPVVLLGILGASPAQADAGWVPAGALADARGLHTVSALADGSALAVGGRGCPRGISRSFGAERYSPSTNAWRATTPVIVMRDRHTATVLLDGRVLVAGGQSTVGACMSRVHLPTGNTAEIYDPVSDRWSATGSLGVIRVDHTATLLRDGRVLVVGGATSAAEIYDPTTGTWRATGSMWRRRNANEATTLADGRVLVTGGSNYPTGEIFDPATETWTETVSVGVGRTAHQATLLRDGRVLISGGVAGVILATAGVYDPAAGTWSQVASMRSVRGWHTAGLLPDGRVLVAGGSVAFGGDGIASAELFDPPTMTWSDAPPMAVARTNVEGAVLRDGSFIAVGGGYEERGFQSAAERFII